MCIRDRNFTIVPQIDSISLEKIWKLSIFNLDKPLVVFYSKSSSSFHLFFIEAHSAHKCLKFNPVYEQHKWFDIGVKACLTQVKRLFDFNMEMFCFEQKTIRVSILNKNNNEPRLRLYSATESTLNTRELMRAMTLFEFRFEDDDMDLNEF